MQRKLNFYAAKAILMLMFISENGISAPGTILLYNQHLRSFLNVSYSIIVCAKVMWHRRYWNG